jgi:hypothetical protein
MTTTVTASPTYTVEITERRIVTLRTARTLIAESAASAIADAHAAHDRQLNQVRQALSVVDLSEPLPDAPVMLTPERIAELLAESKLWAAPLESCAHVFARAVIAEFCRANELPLATQEPA